MIQYPLRLEGGMTRVLESNPASPHLMLLVHGMGARADRWRKNIDPLGNLGYRVIAFDLPGHGLAGKGRNPSHTVETMRDCLLEVWDFARETGAQGSALLIGTSLGGNICAAAAIERASEVKHLFLVGSLGLQPLGVEGRSGFSSRLRDSSYGAVERKLLSLVYQPNLITPDWILEEHKINNSHGASEFFLEFSEYVKHSIDDHVVLEKLKDLSRSLPITLVWGEHDKAVRLQIGIEAARELQCPLEVFRNSAHAPYLEEADRFNAFVAETVETLSA